MSTLTETILRVRNYVTEFGRQHPVIWQRVDMIRGERGRRWWDDWCFLPFKEIPIMLDISHISTPLEWLFAFYAMTHDKDFEYHYRLLALAPWRVTQGVYSFDETVLDALWESAGSDRVPVDIFYRMPEWCIYVATPGRYVMKMPLHGFFATLTVVNNRTLLYLLLDVSTPQGNQLLPFLLPLGTEGITATKIEEYLNMQQDLSKRGISSGPPEVDTEIMRREIFELMPLVSVVIYICVEASAIRNGSGDNSHPVRPRSTQTRNGERLFPPNSPREWQVAYRLGAKLRLAYAAEEHSLGGTGMGHASPRPHIRRGHWHSFWTGRRSVQSERKLVVKWLPPIAVCVDDVEQLVPAVRAVA